MVSFNIKQSTFSRDRGHAGDRASHGFSVAYFFPPISPFPTAAVALHGQAIEKRQTASKRCRTNIKGMKHGRGHFNTFCVLLERRQ